MHEVRDEIHVVVANDGFQGRVPFQKLSQLLGYVEHHHDDDNQGDGQEKRAQEFLDDVPI